jgi:hypothetical protein
VRAVRQSATFQLKLAAIQLQLIAAIRAYWHISVVVSTPEVRLLRKFRAELRLVRTQISDLTQRRDALVSAISGVESLLKLQGLDIERLEGDDDPSAALTESRRASKPSGVIKHSVAVIETLDRPAGAKEIHRNLIAKGIVVNYYTLHRTLGREATKQDGIFSRFGDKFGLRQWAINGKAG